MDGSNAYARTVTKDGTRNAFLIIAMTLFAVVVVHGNIYEQPYLLDLITNGRPPIDTDQPHKISLDHQAR